MDIKEFTPKQVEQAFPVKQAVQENAIRLVNGFENAALAVGDDHSNSDQALLNDLRAARQDLQKFINTLISEVFDYGNK